MIPSIALHLALAASPTAEFISSMSHRPLPSQRVVRLARLVDAAAVRYRVDPTVLAAIVNVESRFEGGLLSCGYATWRKKGAVHKRYTCDYGIAQVNEWWIKRWELDADRLRNDDAYNLKVAARILRLLMRNFGEEPTWYGRYHSSTPSLRAQYEDQLAPLLNMAQRLNEAI